MAEKIDPKLQERNPSLGDDVQTVQVVYKTWPDRPVVTINRADFNKKLHQLVDAEDADADKDKGSDGSSGSDADKGGSSDADKGGAVGNSASSKASGDKK